ncbi:MAG: transposase [bacterium]|nr:transposase [bacterium]
MFNDVFGQLQRGKALEPYAFHEGAYLLSLDGTGYFSSKKIHCDSCLQKKNSKTGEITYQHQMLAAVVVHPDHKQVIPLAPEPIIKQDGDNKNDCERNAGKRLLQKIRHEHPNLKLVVVEDGLASNAPHIRHLKSLDMHFILGAKPDDHEHLFEEVSKAEAEGRVTTLRWTDEAKKEEVQCEIRFAHDLPLNKSNADLLVNFLQYTEYASDGLVRKRFSWVTDLTITRDNARHLVRGGRARWKIENETFNTLKNQGYHFEHNFGHGEQNLSVVLAMLMMLAFLVDQTQERCCPLFQAVHRKLGSRRLLWDHLRSHFRHCRVESMQQLQEAILYDLAKEMPIPTFASRGRARVP